MNQSRHVAAPLETHPFLGGHDEFHCQTCHKPRAVHQDQGFIPRREPYPLHVSMSPEARYGRPAFSNKRMGFSLSEPLFAERKQQTAPWAADSLPPATCPAEVITQRNTITNTDAGTGLNQARPKCKAIPGTPGERP